MIYFYSRLAGLKLKERIVESILDGSSDEIKLEKMLLLEELSF